MFQYLLILANLAVAAWARAGGAPLEACQTFMPAANPHGTEQGTSTPYIVNLGGFPTTAAGYVYFPGMIYPITLMDPNNMETFRGFLIQAVLMADGMTPVGTFVDLPAASVGGTGVMARVGDCTPTGSSVTHIQPTPREDVSYARLYWQAPVNGTGAIQFRYSVVQVLNTWWADDLTTMAVTEIAEGNPTLTPPGTMAPPATTTVAPVVTRAGALGTTPGAGFLMLVVSALLLLWLQ